MSQVPGPPPPPPPVGLPLSAGPPPPAPPPPPGPGGAPWGAPPGSQWGGWQRPPGQPVTGWGWAPQPVLPGSGRFRAQAVGELLDSAFTLYRRNVRLIIAITAVAQLPLALFSYLVYQLTGVGNVATRLQQLGAAGTITRDQLTGLLPAAETYLAVIAAIGLLQTLVVQPIATAAMTRAVGNVYLDQPASFGGAYAAVGRRIWSVVGVSLILFGAGLGLLLAAFALLAGSIALLGSGGVVVLVIVAPATAFIAVFVYMRWLFAAPIVMLEEARPRAALRRSWQLVRGSTWRVFGIILLVGLITGILSAVVGALLSIATGVGDEAVRLILTQLATLLVAVLIQPISFIVIVLLYYDLRIRREAFDIEMLAATI